MTAADETAADETARDGADVRLRHHHDNPGAAVQVGPEGGPASAPASEGGPVPVGRPAASSASRAAGGASAPAPAPGGASSASAPVPAEARRARGGAASSVAPAQGPTARSARDGASTARPASAGASAESTPGGPPAPGPASRAAGHVSVPAAGAGPAGRRGRPRSEAVERAIVETVVRLLEEGVPLSELSIERIARTAGVGKATIYRRWEGKEALFVDVVRSMEPVDPPLPGTSVRDDLVAMVEMLRRRGLAKRSSALLHNVFAQMQSYPQLWDMYHHTSVVPRRERMDQVLRRGIASGEIRADIDFDLLGDLFVGPMLVRTVLRPDGKPEAGSAERIVDAVLQGVRPPR